MTKNIEDLEGAFAVDNDVHVVDEMAYFSWPCGRKKTVFGDNDDVFQKLNIMKRISELIEDIQKHPFKGIGKPEPLKGEQHGLWSRRITDEHRIVYSISSGMIYVYVISLRYHYSK